MFWRPMTTTASNSSEVACGRVYMVLNVLSIIPVNCSTLFHSECLFFLAPSSLCLLFTENLVGKQMWVAVQHCWFSFVWQASVWLSVTICAACEKNATLLDGSSTVGLRHLFFFFFFVTWGSDIEPRGRSLCGLVNRKTAKPWSELGFIVYFTIGSGIY